MATNGYTDKRGHHRFAMSYPIRLFTSGGEEVAKTETLNISQSGTLVALPAELLQGLGKNINITISLPKSSYKAETVDDFACTAEVIRRQLMTDAEFASVALRFSRPLELAT